MNAELQTKVQASPVQNFTPAQTGFLQRKCALCNTPGLTEDSKQDKEKLTLQRSLVDQAEPDTVPRFGHDFSRVSVHSTGPGMIQTKLKINKPGDLYEEEADRVADAVMRMPKPRVQRQPEEEFVQKKPAITPLAPKQSERVGEGNLQPKELFGQSPEVTLALSSSIQSLRGGGQPLPEYVRAYFEPRFGYDFSQVRVHADTRAAESARVVNAHAYTVGHNIVFGAGQLVPGTHEGRRLIAHELTHVVQQSTGAVSSKPVIQRRLCTRRDAPDTIVDDHTVTPTTGISAPGDAVEFAVRFNCEVRGLRSDLEDTSGTSLNMASYPPTSSFPRANFTRNWDGKRSFTRVGTYMVDDGSYRHRLDRVLYAYRPNSATGKTDNLYASGAGLLSPEVQVSTRAGAFSNYSSNHYSAANVETVARIIRSEMGIGNADEQRAVAWAVRNQMVRLNTRDATIAQNHFSDAHGSSATDDSRHLAQEVLAVDMGHDTSGGAIKWFSPRSMPSEGESCARFDCGGGLITVADTSGVNHRKFAPTFHNDMAHVPLASAREWFVRFYRLR